MSSNALRVVPVVDGITDATSICVDQDKIFLGKSNGTVSYYLISTSQALSIPTVELKATVDTSTRRPITSISALGGVVVVISNETAYCFFVSESPTPILLYKGVSAVALNQSSSTKPFIALSVSGGIKKRIYTFSYSSKSGGTYVQDTGFDISTGTDLVTSLVWAGNWMIGSSHKSYVAVNVGERTTKEIFPVDACACICLLKASNEVLLVGHDGLGIFMNIQSDGLVPAHRNTISINHPDACISVVGSYVASVSASDGVVDVFSLTTNDTKLIQTINLPSSGLAATSSSATSVGLPVVAGSVLYLLITIPFETQLKKLIDNAKIEEALEMVNYQYSPGPERDRALKNFHRLVAWKLYGMKEFSVAFVHFSLAGTCEDVGRLLASYAGEEKQGMACFLRGFKESSECKANFDLVKRIDLLLIELLSETSDELVEFIKSGGCSLTLEDARNVVKSPLGLAVLLEQHRQPAEAVQVLLDSTRVPVDDLLDILSRNIDEIPHEMISRSIQLLVAIPEAPQDRLVGLITRSPNPLPLVDGEHVDRSLKRRVLELLANTSQEALGRLVNDLISDDDSETLQTLVIKHQLKDISLLAVGDQFDFCRMILLGNQGRHREAFVQFPKFGERYIETVSFKIPKSQLVLLLCAVLFESNEGQRAVEVLLTHEADVVKDLRSSQILEIIPSEISLTKPLLEFFKRLNQKSRNASRRVLVREHKESYRFLKTYNEWSDMRQTCPVVVNEETLCSICSSLLFEKHQMIVAVLPNGSAAHPTCLDATAKTVSSTSG